MTGKFEYLTKVVVENELEVEDIGECAILANNDLTETWVLIISTELGFTDVFESGPFIGDMEILPKYFSTSYRRLEYSEYKISKIIDKFLNDYSKGITQARVIDKEEAKSYFLDLVKYIK